MGRREQQCRWCHCVPPLHVGEFTGMGSRKGHLLLGLHQKRVTTVRKQLSAYDNQYSSVQLRPGAMLKHQIFRGSLCPHIVQQKEQVKENRKHGGRATERTLGWFLPCTQYKQHCYQATFFEKQSPFYAGKYDLYIQRRRDALTENDQGILRCRSAGLALLGVPYFSYYRESLRPEATKR